MTFQHKEVDIVYNLCIIVDNVQIIVQNFNNAKWRSYDYSNIN